MPVTSRNHVLSSLNRFQVACDCKSLTLENRILYTIKLDFNIDASATLSTLSMQILYLGKFTMLLLAPTFWF